MDVFGSLVDSAKQLAKNAILDKLENRSAGADHPFLAMLHDTLKDLPDATRAELFKTFSDLYETYKAQPHFDFEMLWAEITKHPVIQELAVLVSKKLVTSFLHKEWSRSQQIIGIECRDGPFNKQASRCLHPK